MAIELPPDDDSPAYKLGVKAYAENRDRRPVKDPEFAGLLAGKSGSQVATAAEDWILGYDASWVKDYWTRNERI